MITEMGLGKTVSILALILATSRAVTADTAEAAEREAMERKGKVVLKMNKAGKVESIKTLAERAKEEEQKKAAERASDPTNKSPDYCHTTLVVCPLSVISNWQDQINAHIKPKYLTVYTYHGAQRLRGMCQCVCWTVTVRV